MAQLTELQLLRNEMRENRKRVSIVERAWESQKTKSENLGIEKKELKKENRELKKEILNLKKENQKLKEGLTKIIDHKDSLVNIIFKKNRKKSKTNKKPGGQIGHKGINRTKPVEIDEERDVHLSNCPQCHNELKQSKTVYSRIVEDIVLPLTSKAIKYNIQRQWCGNCKKEVTASPKGTLPNCGFGLNLISYILFAKYRLRLPLNRIEEALKEQYNLKISKGCIQNTLKLAKKELKGEYQKILKSIRESPVKHADETSWRIDGKNSWVWLFATNENAFYSIEATRGKGVVNRILGSNLKGVLVRDDYGAYKKLSMDQQSCWSHLLRKSRDYLEKQDVKEEMKALHGELKQMFDEIDNIIKTKYVKKERDGFYKIYTNKLRIIQKRKYTDVYAQKIQTRIKNQDTNLITTILHKNVPLTNNHAERQIRPMAVTRKISGGSRSKNGADIHAVNMSVVQTIGLKGGSVLTGIRDKFSQGNSYVLERGE